MKPNFSTTLYISHLFTLSPSLSNYALLWRAWFNCARDKVGWTSVVALVLYVLGREVNEFPILRLPRGSGQLKTGLGSLFRS